MNRDSSMLVKAVLVNWLPKSVLNLSSGPCFVKLCLVYPVFGTQRGYVFVTAQCRQGDLSFEGQCMIPTGVAPIKEDN